MKPIIFSTPMIQAILREHSPKTQTRRVIKPQPDESGCFDAVNNLGEHVKLPLEVAYSLCPYNVGDILWVRETWASSEWFDGSMQYFYKSDESLCESNKIDQPKAWKPSIHMPRAAARIFLRVTGVRVEQLQDISEADAIAEGVTKLFDNMTDEEYAKWQNDTFAYSGIETKPKDEQNYTNYLWHGHFGQYGMGNKQSDAWEYQRSGYDTAIGSFSSLWELINAKHGYGWDTNPWVWVYEFEQIKGGV